jgi:hypothetical protein
MRIYYIIASFLVIILVISCTTILVRYESESRLAQKKNIAALTLKQAGDGEETAALTSPLFPAVTIYGDIEKQGQGFIYYITNARLFARWPNGWTEGNYEASGKLIFTGVDGRITCHVEDPFELWDIISGELRYYDVYYREEDALWKVKNRVDRLCEISRFLKERKLSPVYGHIKRKTFYGPGFTKQMKSFLFPERVNFSKLEKKGQLPDEFYRKKGEFPEQTLWGADLWWRADYTKAVFPEYLWQLRNSGTLWRDFEEAPLLFFSLYNIPHFFDSIIEDESFVKIK